MTLLMSQIIDYTIFKPDLGIPVVGQGYDLNTAGRECNAISFKGNGFIEILTPELFTYHQYTCNNAFVSGSN